MTAKLIGAILIICACGGFGFHLSRSQKREEKALQELHSILIYMISELQCRLIPLPLLCYQVSTDCSGSLRRIFAVLAEELDKQITPDANLCMISALKRFADIPETTKILLLRLGKTLGRFDLEGQQTELNHVREECERCLNKLNSNKELRFRTYHTLGLCAGAALAILFI